MPTITENYKAWNQAYAWTENGDEWGRFTEPHLKRILKDWLEPYTENKTVLEIGPGHGRWTEILAKRSKRLFLVDISPNCLDYCRDRFKAYGHIEFRHNNGRDLEGIAAESVDFVWSFNVFVHMEKRETAAYLNEIKRVLRPGGK